MWDKGMDIEVVWELAELRAVYRYSFRELWDLLWTYSKPTWMWSCLICDGCPCLRRGVGPDDLQGSLPTSTILWFKPAQHCKIKTLILTLKLIKTCRMSFSPTPSEPTKRHTKPWELKDWHENLKFSFLLSESNNQCNKKINKKTTTAVKALEGRNLPCKYLPF